MRSRNVIALAGAAVLWTAFLLYVHHGQSLGDRAVRQWAAGSVEAETSQAGSDRRARVILSPGELNRMLDRSSRTRTLVHLLTWLLGMGIIGILARRFTEMGQQQDKERVISLLDEVTGLNNRRAFHALSEPQLAVAEKQVETALVMVVNLDEYEQIVKIHGHEEGNRSMRLVADALMSSFRAADVVARYGDDEFTAFLPKASRDFGGKILERIREKVEAGNRDIGGAYNLSVSIGCAEFDPVAPVSLDRLIRTAFDAMIMEMGKTRDQRPEVGGQENQ